MPLDSTGYIAPTAKKFSVIAFVRSLFPQKKTPPLPGVVLFQDFDNVDDVALFLRLAKNEIADKREWVQRLYETKDGRRCAVGALRATGRILVGGFGVISPIQTKAHTVLLSVAMSRGFADIESMNDNSSHRQVMSAFDEAIERCSVSVA